MRQDNQLGPAGPGAGMKERKVDQVSRQRGVMALIGALAGGSLYALIEVIDQDMLPERLTIGLVALTGAFFTALLAMTGPLSLRKAAMAAGLVAVPAAALHFWASFRFSAVDDYLWSPFPFLAIMVLVMVPLPFLIAWAGPPKEDATGPGWRHYPTLFLSAWTIVVRYAAAWAFVGLVWLVIFLSDQVLSIVGVTVIGDVLNIDLVPFVITGGILGLGLAVVTELADLVSPYLILRLARLLVPAVLLVMAVFLVAVPFQGLSGLFRHLSAALTMLSMVGVAVSLISAAIDQTDAEASPSPLLQRSAQGLCVIVPVMAGFGAWAVWLRAGQYGWTPDRLFAAIVAGFALCYGVAYAVAVLRGAGWMERIRQANIWLALALIAVAALWMSPVLNADRISANSQLARFQTGKTSVEALDLAAMDRWGKHGAAARAVLQDMSTDPAQTALASKLAGHISAGDEVDQAALLATLVAELPLQPAGATTTRDILLAGLSTDDLRNWTAACRNRLPEGKPGCVMVVADLAPREPGEEAILLLNQPGWVQIEGLILRDGVVERRAVWQAEGGFPDSATSLEMLRNWQDAPPPLAPVPMNQLGVTEGLMLAP